MPRAVLRKIDKEMGSIGSTENGFHGFDLEDSEAADIRSGEIQQVVLQEVEEVGNESGEVLDNSMESITSKTRFWSRS